MANLDFPQTLAALRQWVCWRPEYDKKYDRDNKVPYSPITHHRASASNPDTWSGLEEALAHKEKYLFPGVGFVFTAESGIVGIDIDHCLDDDGKPNDTATAILAKTPPTYIEISPSGKGLHIFLRGAAPTGGNKNTETGVEMYSSGRYFTMTSLRYASCSDEIADDNGVIKWIHDTFIKAKTAKKATRTADNQTISTGFSSLTDIQLLEAVRASKDSAAFDVLWRGEWQKKYKSQSEADFALCCRLAFWANHDTAQMDRLFKQSGLFREKWNERHHGGGETYGEITLRRACEMTPETYKPSKRREVSIFEQNGSYYRKRGDTISQLTNFLVHPVEMIVAEDEAQLTCDLITDDGEEFRQTLLADDFTNLQKFKKILNRRTIALSFFGTESDLEPFKNFLHTMEWKRKKGVKALGIYMHDKRLVFVTPTGAVGSGGGAVDTIVQLEKYKCLESSILEKPLITADQLVTLAGLLLSYNEPAKTVPILAWTAGCFIKPHLRRNGAKYPHLFLIGEAGSGKSNTLERVILPIFGRSKINAASQITSFTLMRESCSSNIIPQALDEFKPSKLDKLHISWLHNHFRGSYDWLDGIRGRADQTSVTYDLLAPIIVAGEEAADETAIRERTVELLFSKRDLKNNEYVIAFSELSKNGDLLTSFGRTLLDVALCTTPKEASEWYAAGLALFHESSFPSRIVSNLACVYAGLKLIEKLCAAFKLSWDYLFPLPMEACVNNIIFAAREYLLDGGNHNKSLIEQTFEVMARMSLKPNQDFVYETAGKHLCLWLSGVYDRYTRYRKDYAILGEVLTRSQFCKQLEHSEYFIAKDKVKRLGEKTKRVWVIDFERLSRVADVTGFLDTDVSGAGSD